MSTWLSRNTRPILVVLAASAVVVAAFEVLDAIVASSPIEEVPGEEAAEFGGIAVLAGLIKVSLFLAIGVGITFLVRRVVDRSPDTARS